jgi:hypothetical protein
MKNGTTMMMDWMVQIMARGNLTTCLVSFESLYITVEISDLQHGLMTGTVEEGVMMPRRTTRICEKTQSRRST